MDDDEEGDDEDDDEENEKDDNNSDPVLPELPEGCGFGSVDFARFVMDLPVVDEKHLANLFAPGPAIVVVTASSSFLFLQRIVVCLLFFQPRSLLRGTANSGTNMVLIKAACPDSAKTIQIHLKAQRKHKLLLPKLC
jgi:hypothetical protein